MIVVILIAGVCSTTYTKRYVEERESSASMRRMAAAAYDVAEDTAETTAGAAESGGPETAMLFAAEAAPAEAQAEKEAAVIGGAVPYSARKDSELAEEAGPAEMGPSLPESGMEGAAAAPAALDSEGQPAGESVPSDQQTGAAPLTAAPEAAPATGAPAPNAAGTTPAGPGAAAGAAIQETLAETRSDVIIAGNGKDKVEISYKTRLEELDAEIERNRRADAEKSVANSVKARAENELKLWEAELDGILKALEERLDQTEVEALYTKQREWRREKESKALEAGRRQSGSTLEEVEYSVSLAESTRARAYELVKEYEAVLGE